jgi:predicted nuclease with TOPRIM domain
VKLFEINNKQDKKTGYKRFKLILAEIYDKSCVIDETGTEYNDNGITWIDEYVEKVKDTLIGSSVTVEFVDDSKTDILGHGETGQYKDGVPLLSNATTIGHFDKAYIDEITNENNETKRVFIGEGTLDYMRYSDCIDLLSAKLSNNETIYGSVEIVRTENNPAIVYLYGYKDFGRIPIEFEFSGYALLGCGIQPSDHTASLLELNNKKNDIKEESITMDEKTLGMITDSIKATISECNSKTEEFESKIAELNSALEIKATEVNSLTEKVSELEASLATAKSEVEAISAEKNTLTDELNAVKAEQKKSELNTALADFTDEQKEYAKTEIEAFNADPIKSELNSIMAKIYEGIGKATIASETERAKVLAEQNSKKIDIFADVDDISTNSNDGDSIY